MKMVRDLGLRRALATNQQNLRGGYMRSSLGFEEIFDEQFYSFELRFAKPEAGYFRAIMDRINVASRAAGKSPRYWRRVAGLPRSRAIIISWALRPWNGSLPVNISNATTPSA